MARRALIPPVALNLLASGVVGAVLLFLSDLLVPPAAEPFGFGRGGHGELFARMAEDPFALTGAFPQRKLWPLLAWLFSFVGVGPVAFARVCNGALIAVCCWFAHRRTGRWDAAVLVAAAVAASGGVLVYKPMACFSDPLNLILLVLLFEFAARPRLFWVLVFVSAWSHELVFFFAPWLIYLRCRNGGVWWREGLWLGAVLAAYLLLRAPMTSSYGIAYYLDKNWWVPWLLPALWALWLLLVVVEFGPLLLALGYGWGTDALGGRWSGWLYFLGILPLMLLAYDVMRFAAFAFLPVMLGATAMAAHRRGRIALLVLIAAACITYPWLHPVPSQQGGRHFTEIAGAVFQRIAPHVPQHGPVPLTPAFEVTWWMLTNWWPTFTTAALALLVAYRTRYKQQPGRENHPGL